MYSYVLTGRVLELASTYSSRVFLVGVNRVAECILLVVAGILSHAENVKSQEYSSTLLVLVLLFQRQCKFIGLRVRRS
jgi:hypothetical protein